MMQLCYNNCPTITGSNQLSNINFHYNQFQVQLNLLKD